MKNWFQRKRPAAAPARRLPAKAPLILALEPRVMYDAAIVATAAETAQAVKTAPTADHAPFDAHAAVAADAGAPPAAAGHAVLFVDARVEDAATLLQGVASGTEVVMLQRGTDGLQQMADYLAQHPGASSVQVVAHGDAGNLWLGGTFLSEATLAQHAQQLATIGQGIAQGGDLLIYACNTAQGDTGVRFVDSLAALTGRDVAASDNRTGVGSDWTLEVTTGSIEARPVLSASSESAYTHDLATLTVTSNADSGAGTLRNAIAGATAGDTITFASGMTVTLSSGQLNIAKNLTIEGDLDGNGTPDVTIDANYTSRVFNITAGTVKLDGLVIEHGLVSGAGGNSGNAGVGVTRPGLAGGDALGGGLFVGAATVTLTHDVITGNRAAGGGGGGAAYNGTGYGAGGGGGYSGKGGAQGGASYIYMSGSVQTYAGRSGGGGVGGMGGFGTNTASGQVTSGHGGSTVGGVGGSYMQTPQVFGTAGNGGTAGGIGGGGGGMGYGGSNAGTGGRAVGGIYVASGGTVFLASSTVSNNAGAGGGGGSTAVFSYAAFSATGAGGAGGAGTGGIAVAGTGTLHYEASSTTFSSNVGAGGGGGQGGNGTGTPVTASGGAANTNLVAVSGGTIDSTYVPPPTLTSATYDASTGTLVVTGANMTAGDTIAVNRLSLSGEGGSTYTLTSSNVTASSATSFTVSLNATDQAAIDVFLNKNGTSSTSGTTYNLAGAANWDSTASASADTTGNGVTVSNVPAPTITSATYDASTGTVAVTGTGLLSLAGSSNDIVASKLTFTGEGGSTYTLTDTSNVDITSGTSFSLTLSATDKSALNQILNRNGTSSTGATTYNLAAAEDWDSGAATAVVIADVTGNGITVSNVAAPTITSATYNEATGALVVTGTGFLSAAGGSNDVVASKLSLTGEGGTTYTLTSGNVDITSGTSFTIALNAADQAAINQILNKNGTSSTGGTTYNLAAAEDWNAGADAAVVIADTTGNGITASNVAVPAITSATYDASTGALVVTGTGFLSLSGAANDIVASKFTLTGEGGSTYTLTDTSNVDITSGTSFTLTLSATDKAGVNTILDKNGTSSNGGTTYNLAAAEDWDAGADAAVVIADTTGNGITASNVNSTPVFTNLQGDSVAWAGVGSTVDLDLGGNATATDAELGALNGGNGDWAGASLSVQRAGTAVSADAFGFDAAGASFAVSGSSLQSGGLTFATFTNSAGVLTITFTSSGTAATTALVQDLVHRISYRNDTPAGDATVRFRLSDGNSATTADVTVSSDTIYVTNVSDTATIDVSDGVSLSEAVGIAAADTTGSQTIVLSSTLAGRLVTLAGNLAINESLTLNADAASGVLVSGSTITLAGGTTLDWTDGSGDSSSIGSTLAGSGGLLKSGAGTLSLRSTSNHVGWSGAMSVTGGTLQAATSVNPGNNFSSGTLTLDGGALSLTVGGSAGTSTTIANDLTIGSGGGTISVGGSGSNIADFSGVLSGSGALTKTATAILQLSGSNSGSFTGTTTVSAGTLRADSGSNLGSGAITLDGGSLSMVLTGNTTVSNNVVLGSGGGTLGIDGGAADIANFSGVLSGSGSLAKTGAAILQLSGSNNASFSGATTVSAGTLRIAGAGNLGSGAITLDGATLADTNTTTDTVANSFVIGSGGATFNKAAGTLALTGTLDGSGSLTNTGAGALNQTGSGTLTLDGASITRAASSGSVTLTSNIVIGSGGATVDTTGGDVTLKGNLSGSGGLTKQGGTSGAILWLYGDNSGYSGAQTVASGWLVAGSATALGSGQITLDAGTTLGLLGGVTTFSNDILLAGDATLQSANTTNTITTFSGVISETGGSHNLTLGTGTGTNTGIILAGANAWTGTTTVTGSNVLQVTDASNLSSAGITLGGATLQIDGSGVTLANALNLTGSATLSNANAVTLSGVISGGQNLTKKGAGTLVLTNTETYTGSTTVSAGTLQVDGTLGATSGVTVASGGTLGGTGSIFASASSNTLNVLSGGTLSPGDGGAGTLTVNGNLSLASGSTLAVDIAGTAAGTQYDQVVVNGTVSVSGATLSVNHGYTAATLDSYQLIVNDNADAVTGTFSGLAEGATLVSGGDGQTLQASYVGGSGNDFTLTVPNQPPVVSSLNGDSVSFTEKGSAVLLDAGGNATVTDSDNANFNGGNVTVSIVTNRLATEDVLSVVNQGTGAGQVGVSGSNVTYGGVVIGSFTGGSGSNDLVISLNANATPAATQALVRDIAYGNTNTTDPAPVNRIVRTTVNDGSGGTSSNADVTVGITTVNDAPTLSATTGTPTFTENGAAVGLFSGAAISPVESGQSIRSLTLTVSNVADGSSEVLDIDGTSVALTNGNSVTTATNGMSVSVSLAGGTATVTISNASGISAGAAQTLVDGLSYRDGSDNPSTAARVVTLTSIQDTGGTSNGGVDTTSLSLASTVSVTAVNDAPTIAAPASIAVTEDVTATLSGISFADVDGNGSTEVASFAVGSGTLNATSGGGITVGGSGTGSLTLTGSLANIDSFIAGGNLSFTPAANATSNVTLNIGIDDGGNTGTGGAKTAATTVTLALAAVNDAPVNGVPASQSLYQNSTLAFTTANGNLISVSDVDAGGGTEQVTLTVTHGTLALSTTTGLSFLVGSGTGDATMTLQGTLANIDNALNGMVYSPTTGYNGPASLQITTNDLGNTGSGGAQTATDTVAITVAPINPLVTNVTSTTPDGGYKVGDNVTVTVSFDQVVNVDTSGGAPTLLLETGSTDHGATYVSGSGTNTLSFNYTVQPGDVSSDLDYASTGALALNGATIRSGTNFDAVLTLPATGGANSIAGQKAIVIDGVAPTVTSVSVPANGTYVAGQSLDFTVHYSEAVVVDTSGGTPRLAITLDTGGTVYADYVSGSGTTALVFRHTVATGENDPTGIQLGTGVADNGGTVRDAVGNDAVAALQSVPSTGGVQVDAIAPTVTGIAPASGAQAFDRTVSFTVTFSEDVAGVDAADFHLLAGATATGRIAGVSQVDARTYAVLVDGVGGQGSLTLQLAAAGSAIQDAAGNALARDASSAAFAVGPLPVPMLPPAPPPGHGGPAPMVTGLPPAMAPQTFDPGIPANFGDTPTLAASQPPAWPPSHAQLTDNVVRLEPDTLAVDSLAGPIGLARAPAAADRGAGIGYIEFGAGAGGLSALPDVGSFAVQPGQALSIVLPVGTFTFSTPGAHVDVTARQADGRPLPAWLRFDPVSGRLFGQPPPGAHQRLSLELVARDGQGREARTHLLIEVGTAARQGALDMPPARWAEGAPATGRPALAAQFARHGGAARDAERASWQEHLRAAARARPT